MRILGPLDWNRDDVVVVQNLDGALRAADAACDDDHCRATLSCPPDISNPICYPAAELHGGLAADLMNTAVLNRQLLEARRRGRAHGERVPIHKRLFRRQRNDVPPSLCLLKAVLQLIAEFDRLLTNEVQLGDDPVHPAWCSGHEIDDRDQRLAVVESLARRDELNVICRPCGSLSRRIETADRLDHVADEFDAYRFEGRRRKHVDDSSANGEGTVLIDGVFAREAAVDEQIGQLQRLDL